MSPDPFERLIPISSSVTKMTACEPISSPCADPDCSHVQLLNRLRRGRVTAYVSKKSWPLSVGASLGAD